MGKYLFSEHRLNTRQVSLFGCFVVLFCLLGCETEKKKNELKEAFFCTINGEEFYPQKLISNSYEIYYNEKINGTSPSSLIIAVTSDRFRYGEIRITVSSNKIPIGVGEYILKEGNKLLIPNFDYNNAAYASCYFQDRGEKEIIFKHGYSYETTPDAIGYINISKIDTVQGIITGTFYFTAVNEIQEKVVVQNGYFNTKYK